MENTEMIYALAEPKQSRIVTKMRNLMTGVTALSAVTGMAATQAFAIGNNDVSVVVGDSTANADTMMGKIIGILLTISQYVGVALVIYGVYEVIMSFMQNQPEAKTKGIIMALAGAVMIGLKSILQGMGVIGGGA